MCGSGIRVCVVHTRWDKLDVCVPQKFKRRNRIHNPKVLIRRRLWEAFGSCFISAFEKKSQRACLPLLLCEVIARRWQSMNLETNSFLTLNLDLRLTGLRLTGLWYCEKLLLFISYLVYAILLQHPEWAKRLAVWPRTNFYLGPVF